MTQERGEKKATEGREEGRERRRGMISPSMRDEVFRELEKLDAADQERVMDFVRALRSAEPHGTPGSELTRFAGILSKGSVDEMMAAIEDGCERIDDEW
jgi:hypothetical protein